VPRGLLLDVNQTLSGFGPSKFDNLCSIIEVKSAASFCLIEGRRDWHGVQDTPIDKISPLYSFELVFLGPYLESKDKARPRFPLCEYLGVHQDQAGASSCFAGTKDIAVTIHKGCENACLESNTKSSVGV